MSRTINAANITEIAATAKFVVIFYEGEFGDAPITFTRLWTGIGPIAFGGNTFSGIGHLGSISPVKETRQIRSTGVVVSLTGVDPTRLTEVLANVRHGRIGRLYMGFLNAAEALVADPELFFEGPMDIPQVDNDGTNATITIAYESRLRDGERPRSWRYTTESQQKFYPNDLGFEFVPELQQWNGKWGE